RSDGEMFWFLSNGVHDGTGRPLMPGFGDRLSEGERRDLIDFVRTLADAEPGDNAPLHHRHRCQRPSRLHLRTTQRPANRSLPDARVGT
ncbi:MAG: cytochrome c, partial [Acetobacteraceae bacterium]|nr:cytochrome c [Acetobacteraceae bacterium]